MFNIEQFDIQLETEILGRNFLYFEEIDSTNTYLLTTREKLKNGTVVLAEMQLHGKGRRNRNWESMIEQSLTFSVLLNDELESQQTNLINLATSLSVAQALENLYQLNVELKWPNDILVNRKKIAGILLESSSKGSKLEKMILGIGLNVNQPNFKGKFQVPPTSVRMELKKTVSREKLLSETLNLLEDNLITLDKNQNKILNNWRHRCKLIGEKVKIIDEKSERYGVFEDIDDDGYMLLKIRNTIEKIHFGDVSLGT